MKSQGRKAASKGTSAAREDFFLFGCPWLSRLIPQQKKHGCYLHRNPTADPALIRWAFLHARWVSTP